MFYIIEIQKMENGTFGHLVYTAEDEPNAWSTYYSKLAYAAVSTIPMHTVVLLTADGEEIEHKAFWHDAETNTEE